MKINRNGDMQDHTVTVVVQARAVNDVDAPLSGWNVVLTKAFTAKTVDAVRETCKVSVAPARYEVQVKVTAPPHTEKDADNNTYRDTCVWGCRIYSWTNIILYNKSTCSLLEKHFRT